MKFIQKHTAGPWKKAGPFNTYAGGHYEVQFGDEECIAEYVHEAANADAISQIPAMVNYMVKRAELLHGAVESFLDVPENMRPKSTNNFISELSLLLEIIRAAGVEVVDE